MAPPTETAFRANLKRGFVWLGSARVVSLMADLGGLVAALLFLSREELGLATLSWSIAVVLEAFNGLGIGAGLVQAKTVSRAQFDSIFWYVIGIAALLFGIAALSAPWIAAIYEEPELSSMIVVSASKLLLVGAALVPLQRLNRHLRFRLLGQLNALSSLLSNGVKVALAAAGYGAWALVIGHMSYGLVILVAVYCVAPWRPRPRFAFGRIRGLAAFGWRVATSDVIFHFSRNADYILVGKFLGTEALGVYRVAFEVAMKPGAEVLHVINRAAFPVFARLRSTPARLAEAFAWTTRGLAFVLVPIAVLLWFVAPHIVLVVGAGKWAAAEPVIRLLCGAAVLRTLTQLFPPLFHATRPGLAVLEAVVSCSFLVGAFLFALSGWRADYGIEAMGWAWLLSYPLLWLFAWSLARRIVPLRLAPLIAALRHPIGAGLTTAAALFPTRWIPAVASRPLTMVLLQGALTAAVLWAYARWRLHEKVVEIVTSGDRGGES